ncbi:ABC transporter ATP-binding protein [Sediminibacterium ginsengisoli]|uniref:Peptide/nickel transport system ATP-binding protein n=1 Tax=Sediminibacterium ginsengisoli TaxID=413434 RepID=A0A1T4QEL4_9BACT|nr:ABC transporter ATP-binding protein [Sediminibacterium ginsengisoli]SKA01941.1 peptide/nickel transport system ATP-binding protein [Sediminibacterium ginsengisoli]
MAINPLLEIRQLCVDFTSNGNTSRALHHVDLTVNPGEIVAIVGESGSGKSVTSLSVLRLLPQPPAIYCSGQILFDTGNGVTDLLKADEEMLQSLRGSRIAMIFQEPMTSLNPVLTCGYQVTEAIMQHRKITKEEARERALALFEKVQLPDPGQMFSRYPHQLSGGQKQRVMIAMAMSCEPSLLICDEPTTALDVTVQKNILLLIKELQQQNGMGVIFITHDLGVVAEIADRVVVMYRGRIVEENTTAALMNQPAHPYTRALLACRPARHPKGERLPVVSDFMDADGNEKPPPSVLPAAEDHFISKSSDATLLKVEDLHVYYPGRKTFLGKVTSYTRAVDHVSFELKEGETLGLVGESGCGKSTLGRAILQLQPATGGRIFYKGTELLGAAPSTIRSLRRDMQIIFQDPYSSLNPRISIGSAIAEPLAVHGIIKDARQRREKVNELLEKVNLSPDHYNRYPHEFSGGQRQRIVIARALALNPSFVICDESVSALDVSVQAQVLNLLNDLKKEFGFTAIFISHDLSVVRYISDRIMVMNKGKIEESGLAEEVYNSPQSAYTQRLIASIPGGKA